MAGQYEADGAGAGRPDTQERRLQKEPLSSSSMMFREDRKEMKAKDRTQLDGKYDLEDRT